MTCAPSGEGRSFRTMSESCTDFPAGVIFQPLGSRYCGAPAGAGAFCAISAALKATTTAHLNRNKGKKPISLTPTTKTNHLSRERGYSESMSNRVGTVAVYCASSERSPEIYLEAAARLGKHLAESGFGIVYG